MLHPYTELRFVSDEIGYGIFATQDIPKGTITWVKDQLDRVFTLSEVQALSALDKENLLKYTYRNCEGHFVFCWDLTRFINHSYEPNSMLTTLGFEIALCDIKKGDELTNDYGTLNIIEPFKCAHGPDHERDYVRPDDLLNFHQKWDQQIHSAMEFVKKVTQPLDQFLSFSQQDMIKKISNQQATLPSVIRNYFKAESPSKL